MALTLYRREVGVVLQQTIGANKPLYICSVFRRLRGLMTSIFWTKHEIDSRVRALRSMMGLLHRLKISSTLVCKRHSNRTGALITLRKLCVQLRWQALYTEVSKGKSTNHRQTEGGKWRWYELNKVARIANVNEIIEIRSLVSRCPKTLYVSSGIETGGLQWQYIVIR